MRPMKPTPTIPILTISFLPCFSRFVALCLSRLALHFHHFQRFLFAFPFAGSAPSWFSRSSWPCAGRPVAEAGGAGGGEGNGSTVPTQPRLTPAFVVRSPIIFAGEGSLGQNGTEHHP